MIVSGAWVIVCVTGGSSCGGGGGASDAGRGGPSDVGGADGAVVLTVVDDGVGVLSLLRSTNHTANAIARSTRTRPPTRRPNGIVR